MISLKVYAHDEQVPEGVVAFQYGMDEWLRIRGREGSIVIMPGAAPYILELIEMAKKGEKGEATMLDEATKHYEATVDRPMPPLPSDARRIDSLTAQAIREVGAGIIEAMGEHTWWLLPAGEVAIEDLRAINATFQKIVEKVRGIPPPEDAK